MTGATTALLLMPVPVQAQPPENPAAPPPLSLQYTDPINGLSLDAAIARAVEREPSIRAARTEVDAARGMLVQAGLRPNPTASFERREEPAGTDNQTTVAVEWPLDLFRREGRVAVAEGELEATRHAAADRERLLAAGVRARYGDVLIAARQLAVLDDLVAAVRRQEELVRARVREGASPPLEQKLFDVELRRIQSERLLQAGRTEAAMFELKRAIGLTAETPLRVRDNLEDIVQREARQSPFRSGDPTAGIDNRADVRQAEARVRIGEALIEEAERNGRFDVSLFGTYMRMDAGFPQLGLTSTGAVERVHGLFHYVAGGVRVTMPLFDRNQGELAAARAKRAGAAATYDAARLRAQAEIAAARARDEHAQQAVSLYVDGTEHLARQNLEVVSQTYDLGRATVFDVLAEQRRYLEVERAYTDALAEAFEARTALKQARGDVR